MYATKGAWLMHLCNRNSQKGAKSNETPQNAVSALSVMLSTFLMTTDNIGSYMKSGPFSLRLWVLNHKRGLRADKDIIIPAKIGIRYIRIAFPHRKIQYIRLKCVRKCVELATIVF